VGGAIIAFVGLLPYSIPLALVLFSLLSLISCIIVYEPLKKRIIAKN
jgi:membrane protein implicated in regulation of membrane protease activity